MLSLIINMVLAISLIAIPFSKRLDNWEKVGGTIGIVLYFLVVYHCNLGGFGFGADICELH